MIIVRNIKLSIESDFSDIFALFTKTTGLKNTEIKSVRLFKRSIDARKKDSVHYNCAFLVEGTSEKNLIKQLKKFDASYYCIKKYKYLKTDSSERPIIAGFGPAGMFAALALAKAGLRPIVIERGKNVEERKKDVDAFFAGGKLNENSNVQFGEGGAGTFSDGKLNTGINDYRIREVLNVFYNHGADENILYDSKPHIGTDVLIKVVKSIREEITALGGEILFEHKLEKIVCCNSVVKEITVKSKTEHLTFGCNFLVLAPGHSARDTFEMLNELGIEMQPKAFAIGARIEHKQNIINKAQYGQYAENPALAAADYKLSCHLDSGRGVFTFCMCPGGEVVNASSENDGVVTNGMSYKSRGGENANSAILVGINVEDYYNGNALDGMYFQRKIERKAFEIGRGFPVSQSLKDFKDGKVTTDSCDVKPTILPHASFGDVNKVLPEYVCESIKEAVDIFDKKIKGFADGNSIITAPETRSSSPIRILRNEQGEASIGGIYPCGEGAGYAGGITSAAVDGLKTAEKIIIRIQKQVGK